MRTTVEALAFLAGMALIAAGPVVAPAHAQQEQRVPVDQATTKQKAIFLRNLVTKSVAAETIEKSGDAAAKAKLAEARALVDEAHRDLDAGRVEDANAKLDRAIGLVNAETRRLSQADMKACLLYTSDAADE